MQIHLEKFTWENPTFPSYLGHVRSGTDMSRSPGRWGGGSDKKPNQKLSCYFTIGSKGRRVGFAIFPKTISMYL